MTFAATSIRLIESTDASVIADHLARDEEASSRWDPKRPPEFYTTKGQIERIELLLGQYLSGQSWPGVIVSDGAVIGQITISGILRGPFQKGYLGYWVASPFQNMGHASRAVTMVLRVMSEDLGLHRAEASTQIDNFASHKVLRNNGFGTWGTAHSHIYIAEEWRDSLFWERTLSKEAPSV